MIRFDNWTLQADGDILARQFDNLTRTLTVSGDLPEGWEWSLLVQAGEAMDILLLQPVEGGVGIVLTAQQLSIAGYYQMQLRGTQGDLVQHTNTITVYIPASLSGDAHWPEIPSEFTQLERRVNEKAKEAEGYTSHPPIIGENGNWWEWDGEAYVDTGKPSRGGDGGHYTPAVTQPDKNTMKVEFSPSKEDMPAVEPVTVSLPAGPEGAPGKTPVRGVDYYTPEDVEAIVADATTRVEASFGGTYELVEEITTTEDLTQIDRTAWPDGTKYNFKEMIVKCVYEVAAGTNGQVNVTFQNRTGSQWTTLGTTSGQALNQKKMYHWNHCYNRYGFWNAQHGYSSSVYASAVYQMTGYAAVISNLSIDALNIKATTSGIPIPAGTNIKIYGVRA